MIFKYFIDGIKISLLSLFRLIKYFFIGLITCIIIIPYYFYIGLLCLFVKEKRENYGFKKSMVPLFMLILSLTVYFISIFILTRWFVQSKRIKKMSESVISETEILKNEEKSIVDDYSVSTDETEIQSDYNVINRADLSFIDVNFSDLLARNPDTVAWIVVNGTNINYPVVQYSDNEYYLTHDFNRYETNVGWVFGDYRNNFENFDNNTILYAHNLINKTMFGSLPRILKNNWYSNENNRYVKTATANSKAVWQVFSVYEIDPVTDYLRTVFVSETDYSNWLATMKNRSIYNFDVDVGNNDKILTLSTCNDIGNKRVVLQAKLINIEYK